MAAEQLRVAEMDPARLTETRSENWAPTPSSGAKRIREPIDPLVAGHDLAGAGVDGEADAGAQVDAAADLPADEFRRKRNGCRRRC